MSSSSDIAISVRGLGKAYTIAHTQAKHTTAAEALMSRLRRPLQRSETETFWALKDVSFDVRRGDVVGIIGRNGAGKSTLLKVLSRITEPTTGEIDLYGRVGSLLEVGTGFHPELTGRENIFLNGAILGMRKSEIQRQFDAIVDFAGVEQFLDTPVKRYSSGMYVRLAFAVAAHLRSEILVVDEVLAVGDAEFQKKCLGKMKDVASGGRTVLFVSHNLGAIRSLCRTALVVSNGELTLEADAEEACRTYLHEMQTTPQELDSPSVVRSGTGEMRLTGIQLLSQDAEVSQVSGGDDVVFAFAYKNSGTQKHAQLLLTCYDQQDTALFHLRRDIAAYAKEGEVGNGVVHCQIRRLPLNIGRYRLAVALQDPAGQNLDHVSNAFSFDVVSCHFYNNGQTPDPRYSPFLVEHQFTDGRNDSGSRK
ncbi:MAG: ABC transporter ATP-binding protein [Armatimonadetes bacterium]|nr:ABC transporter ATP-binding protein [Armatimonadota bacterium]